MSDDGDTLDLPPELLQIAGQEGARINNLGTPLPGAPDWGDAEIVIQTADGGLTLGIGDGDFPAPAIRESREPRPFGENIAKYLDDSTLANIASEIVQGVEADIVSHSTQVDQYSKGIDLLGTKVEEIANRSQRKNISRAGHPLMIEAMVKYWAGAAGEMLPAGGPVKVPTIGEVPDDIQALADAFEDDFNYFLTFVDKGYRPDTSQMLMQQAFIGIGYKKVYRDPLRDYPISRAINFPDLIISPEAVALETANRVTHRIDMMRAQVKRLQIVGQYCDVDLGMPGSMAGGIGGAANRKIRENEGMMIIGFGLPKDQPYEIWETDADIDIDEHDIDLGPGCWERKTPNGLPLPYKIAVERNSHKILGIWRNWRPTDPLCRKRNMYVKFGLVPGMGYYNWGFLHLLGNQTRVLRSIWRILIDAGMFSNFPGGIKAKQARTQTNEISPGPGEFVDIDLQPNQRIQDLVMPMPYKDVSANFVQLSEIIKGDAKALAGTVMLEVGEGRTNVPVGTILSLVEQQVQVMAEVFKGNHDAQKEELLKLRELFAENPRQLAVLCRDRPQDPQRPQHMWEKADEFTNLLLQPASDPNLPSRIHRVMMTNVMLMIAQQMPQLFDLSEIGKDAMQTIGKDPDRFLARGQAQAPPDPKIIAETIKQQIAQAKQQSDAAQEAARLQVEREKLAVEAAKETASDQTDLAIAHAHGNAAAAQPYHEAAANLPLTPMPGGGT